MVTIKRVSVGSAMKIGAITYTLTWAIFGLIFLAFQGLFLSAITSSLSSYSNQFPNQGGAAASSFGAIGIAGLCITYVVGLIFALIAGAIGGAVYAFIYNLAAGWVGGLEVELTRIQAPATANNNLPPM